MTARATRSSTAEAKVMGYRVREPQEVEDENDVVDSDLVHVPSTAWWGDEISSFPSALEETCTVLQVTLKTVEAYTSMFKIDDHVPRCLFLIRTIVWAKMKFRSELAAWVHKLRWHRTDIILGNVWVIRNPYKLLADTRKVKAVYKPQLANYTDVIACSVKGHRRRCVFMEL
ncbi:hypothetical protein FIBSPDRAFT_1053117 [Athelia psychrophila]|nr:hypothetical protein FIBSPDRAFT_1053117 [Fibularhizoctonia sp. CBS 109695]